MNDEINNSQNKEVQENNITPTVDINTIEEVRKEAVKGVYKGLGLAVVIFFLMLILFEITPVTFMIFFFLLFFIPSILSSKKTKQFNELFKNNIVAECFKSKFTDVVYKPKEGISRETIRNTGMMTTGDIYSSNDYLKAKYKDITFESADIHIQDEYTDSDGDTQYVTIFKGQWYIFDFNKSFKSDIQVCEKGFNGAKRGNLFDKKSKFQKAEMEDIEFNKQFKVFAREPIEAYYILTPSTMTRIKELNEKLKGSFLFCFTNNKLHVGLHNHKDLYQHSIFKPVDIVETTNNVLNELSAIIDFIEILKLDNTLFK